MNSPPSCDDYPVLINAAAFYKPAFSLDGACIVSTYISPNATMEHFEKTLDDITGVIDRHADTIITGDFNAKNVMWGGMANDERGWKLAEWTHQGGLIVLNDGKKPTCIRYNGVSYIDLTIATPAIAKKMRKWEVLEDEVLSDHNVIYTNIQNTNVKIKSGWELYPKIDQTKIRMIIDSGLILGKHIKSATDKALKLMGDLNRLMPNIGGPGHAKRRVIALAAQSVIMYGAPIWAEALRVDKYKNMLKATQRQMNIKITASYRTVSAEALCIISKREPLELLAMAWKKRNEIKTKEGRKEANEELMAKWQSDWDKTKKAEWTRRLIPQIQSWVASKISWTDYYMSQFLSGHGCFMLYLHRIKKKTSDRCLFCEEIDGPEHTFFQCTKWKDQREEMTGKLGDVTPENVIRKATKNEEAWAALKRYVTDILQVKEETERQAN
ncbi:hypothetical protein PPYR_01835 [Photinus pyralis]|uniref:Endonuclease/exonuclease/phosphatase domain-containing protein n=1 Tax=Photinus pyralis TaxID=7054 RepID=A0A5N4B5I3_PHOPY|nr:hypothetical protein PPYR_01835 [Photinus pyralis]